MDDRGWGCAYRALQTIVSWYRAQRYTQAPVPSHKEVQLALVKLGACSSRTVSCTALSTLVDTACCCRRQASGLCWLQGVDWRCGAGLRAG